MSRFVWFADDMSGYVPLCVTETFILPGGYEWVPVPCAVEMKGLELLYWRIRMRITRRPARNI